MHGRTEENLKAAAHSMIYFSKATAHRTQLYSIYRSGASLAASWVHLNIASWFHLNIASSSSSKQKPRPSPCKQRVGRCLVQLVSVVESDKSVVAKLSNKNIYDSSLKLMRISNLKRVSLKRDVFKGHTRLWRRKIKRQLSWKEHC